MAIRNAKLGGTDLGEEAGKPSDWNGTMNAILDFAGLGLAEGIYQQLVHAGNVTNGGSFVADRFTDSDGAKNTVNTGSSTSVYSLSNDNYSLIAATGNTQTETNSSSETGQTDVTFDGTIDSSSGYFSVAGGHQVTSTSTTWQCVIKKDTTQIASKQVIHSSNTYFSVSFDRSDYSELLENGDAFTVEWTRISGTSGMRESSVDVSKSGTYWSITNERPAYSSSSSMLTFTEYIELTTGTVVIDTNTKTLDGTENSIIVYGDIDLPINTTLTVDISDGTTTLSTQPLNNLINIQTLTAVSDLKLTFNLDIVSGTDTPTLSGYGVYIK